jgi:CubicO group peptidase (beta-lactamase class C family)
MMSDSAITVFFDEKIVDAIFADLDRGHGPGCAVGIAVGGTPVYRKGFGLANMEQPIVLSPATRMPIGSMTKQFTCLAFMLLAEEGRVSPDDTIGDLLPELHPATHAVMMRQLMGHLGGVRDAYEIITLFSGMGNQVTAGEALSIYRRIDDVNFAPGAAWSYNNGGYVILAAVIERVTGQPLRETLRQRIFEPAGLYDTLLRPFERDFLPGAATLHAIGPSGAFEKGYRFLEGGGQGGIYSTVDDMLRWLRHMDSPTVGTAETWRLMTTPMSLSHGDSTRYGMGLIASEHRGLRTVHHSGSVVGGNSQMIKAPDAGLDIVVMVNRGDVSAATLASRVFDACLPNLPPAAAPAEIDPVQGLFRSPRSGRVVQLFTRNGQQIASIDGVDMIHFANAGGVLSPPFFGVPERQSIRLIGERENASAIELTEFGRDETFVALHPAPDADARQIVGRYRSETIGAEVIVGANRELRANGRFGSALYEIEPLAEDLWRGRLHGALPVVVILSFEDDRQVLRVSSGFERGVTFRRV